VSGPRIGDQIVSANPHMPVRGTKQTNEHFDCCGFARPVGAEEREEFSSGDSEAEVVNGGLLAVSSGDMTKFNHQWLRVRHEAREKGPPADWVIIPPRWLLKA
jgi:hypothetical protein